jgi:hypothetical protein
MLFIDLGRHVSIRFESPAGPLEKTTHPLHGNIKTRCGIPKVHNQFIFAIYMSLFCYYSFWIQLFLDLKTLKHYYAYVSCVGLKEINKKSAGTSLGMYM